MVGRRMKIPIEIVLLAAVLLVWFPKSNGHYHTAYEHSDTLEPHNPINWMKDIPNYRQMQQLSLPGTHDTLAVIGTVFARCQTTKLDSQLEAGIRFLDVRCKHAQDKFPIHHGIVFLDIYFNEVLAKVATFLNRYPTETIFMSVGEEDKGNEDLGDLNNNKTFEEVFAEYIKPYENIRYDPNSNDTSLGAMRGKIVYITGIQEIKKYGISWSKMDKQDMFDLKKYGNFTDEKMYAKWEYVKSHLIKANKDQGNTKWFVTFLSGTNLEKAIFPYFVASGHLSPGTNAIRMTTGLTGMKSCSSRERYIDYPRNFCVFDKCKILFEGTNILAHDFIHLSRITYTGIVIADFPGKGLIDTVINLNFQ